MEIPRKQPADFGVQKLVELAQNSDIDLRNFVHPDVIRRTRAVDDVSSDPVIGSDGTSTLRRTVGLGDNVDSRPLKS